MPAGIGASSAAESFAVAIAAAVAATTVAEGLSRRGGGVAAAWATFSRWVDAVERGLVDLDDALECCRSVGEKDEGTCHVEAQVLYKRGDYAGAAGIYEGLLGDGRERGDADRRELEANYYAACCLVWNSNLQPDFNVSVCDTFDASSSAMLRELDESNRFVQKSAESTSI